MKKRTSILAAALLCVLSLGASAQTQGRARVVREAQAQQQLRKPVLPSNLGSVERTKILEQAGRGGRKGEDVLRYGSVERRAALTGTTVRWPKPLGDRNHTLRVHTRR